MSRRLRLEEERAKAVKEEEIFEDPLKIQLKRIFSPLVWKETSYGIRIQDLKEDQHEEVVNMFKDHFLENDVLCKNTELLNDEESLACYLRRIRFQIRDSSSIIAVDLNYVHDDEDLQDESEAKLKIVGVLILKVMRKNEFNRVFSQVQLIEGEAMKKCVAFRSHINRRVDIHEKCNCDVYLRYYELCVLPQYRHQSLGYLLMMCGVRVARSYNIPVVAGLFPTLSMQTVAKRLGMETIYEVSYCAWRDREGELIFDDPGAGNYTCAVMAGPVPPPPSLGIVPSDSQMKLTRPKTRAEKQMLRAKAKN
ncbi:uncharacterized protein LOC116178499 [Photinus pyralis]|uniref:uncharacterized protein LOC116170841 n=1 Tax=Photinus pyralis TaxID=7054 RepID=UPI00126765FD|nr:uncharacterized protein LOC116170841 [Photinus pyralis]XP_031353865.1 uncharacterized protein LOC116178499 [Photinus pyralis]